MNKTKIAAVKKTIKQWEWYIENPNEKKRQYFETYASLPVPYMNDCYLCGHWWKYDIAHDYLNCKECPLATRTLICDGEIAPNNPYDRWDHFNSFKRALTYPEKREKIKQAKRIVGACKRWLKKYDV